MTPTRSHSIAEEGATSPPPSIPHNVRARVGAIVRGVSFSRFQSVVATLAGIASVTGAAFSLVQYARPGNTGELVAIVLAAGSHRSVTDATVEVLTTENALVASLTPDSAGRVTQVLKEGVYVVRVSHPRYAADVRRIQVQPRQTIEIKTTLRAGSSSPIERAVSKGAGSIRRALGF
jgi:Carboxypeptidase regulatory-like domain